MVPLVHRDPGVRPMDDLDLLVHRDDLASRDRAIRALGYVASASPPVADTGHGSSRAHFSPHHLAALVRADGKVTIELHHKLGSSGSALDFDVAGLWGRAVPCTAGEVACLRPSSEDLLAHLCLHFLVDRVRLFSRRALGQLCDIAATIDTFADTLEWDTLTRDAADRGYARALALALGTAAAVLGVRPPATVPSALAPHPVPSPGVGRHGRSSRARGPRRGRRSNGSRHANRRCFTSSPEPRRWLPARTRQPGHRSGCRGVRSAGASRRRRILLHPDEVAAERRFAADLQALGYPQGLPDGSDSDRRLRRSLQARLTRASLAGSTPVTPTGS